MAFRKDTNTRKEFSSITISLASPEQILEQSRGEVTKPETINYRTYKPDRDGLFCEKIFGPTKDWECNCGKYKRIRYRGIVCDRCGVEVTERKVRRERMGHINLVVPVVHIWFVKKIAALLGLQAKQLDTVIYYSNFIVIQAGDAEGMDIATLDKDGEKRISKKDEKKVKRLSLLSEEQYFDILDRLGPENRELDASDPRKFIAKMGAEGLYDLLGQVNLTEEAQLLRDEANQAKTSQQKKTELLKRLQVFEAFRTANQRMENRPEWMIVKIIQVIPPELRPLLPLDGGRWAASDLNELYRRVIIRNNRLKKLIDIKAPDVILRNEKRMLQEAVDSLFDGPKKSGSAKTDSSRTQKSLAESLKGKKGRFRQNLLGKRVDYSGRSVIVVGPELHMNECGVPKDMAAELFKPFIIRKILERGIVKTVKSAKKIVERKDSLIWDILENVMKGHPVLLNRAPTLHRIGIQAFQPRLVEGKAIRLHPLCCTAFNADFDGDQMAIHVPLGNAATMEAQMLMLASHNILNPANGAPITVPSQDMVLGLYYITKPLRTIDHYEVIGKGTVYNKLSELQQAYQNGEIDDKTVVICKIDNVTEKNAVKSFEASVKNIIAKPYNYEIHGQGGVFYSPEEVIIAYNEKRLHLNATIKCKVDIDGTGNLQLVDTTVGRVLFNQVVPSNYGYINMLLTKKALRLIISSVLAKCGNAATVKFLDDIMGMGYRMAFVGGLSFNLGDVLIPKEKAGLIADAKEQISEIRENFEMGFITDNERSNKTKGIWSETNIKLTDRLVDVITSDRQGFNPVFMMLDSGARGSKDQIRQLAGMRGLMAKPTKAGASGSEVIENPILSNFKEGLSVYEYFISTHGARKGLADTALKTADAGYLTRRLVDVAHDVIITESDCGTLRGKSITPILNEKGQEVVSIGKRIIGRTSLHDIYDPRTASIIVSAGEEIDEKAVKIIEEAKIEEVEIRSVPTCESKQGICQKCYGRNLATGKLVQIGEAVGVIAAQSIGEPGTQLTLRTFHTGGVAGGGAEQGEFKAPKSGIITISDLKSIPQEDENGMPYQLVISRGSELKISDEATGTTLSTHTLNYGSELFFQTGDKVQEGVMICRWDAYNNVIMPEIEGKIHFKDLKLNVTFKAETNLETQNTEYVIIESKLKNLIPSVEIHDTDGQILRTIPLPVGAHISTLLLADEASGAKSNKLGEGDKIKADTILAKVPRQTRSQGDITGGLPRVTELFEARNSSDPAIVSKIDGIVTIDPKLNRTKRVITITPKTGDASDTQTYLIPATKQLLVQDGDHVAACTPLCAGDLTPEDILQTQGAAKVQEYIINEIQGVYRLQGVEINDKHFEVIVRQMMRKMEIEDAGDTKFLQGDFVNKIDFQEENDRIWEMKVVTDAGDSTTLGVGQIVTPKELRDENSLLKRRDLKLVEVRDATPATGKQVLQGITKAALQIRSFISAASFQETTKILTNAAIAAEEDHLLGLKENVIIGHLIPAGTGLKQYQNIEVSSMEEYEALMASKNE